MNKEPSPLQILADIMVSKKEIQVMLQKHADAEIAGALACMYSEAKAKASAKRRLENWLQTRAFSNFGREKMLNRVIAKSLKNCFYTLAIRRKRHESERDQARHEKEWERHNSGDLVNKDAAGFLNKLNRRRRRHGR